MAGPAAEVGPQPGSDPATTDELITTWGLLTEAVSAVRQRLAAGLEAAGHLTLSELDVMIRLLREPGHRLPMSQLAGEVGLTSGGFTKLADRMEHERRIEREYSTRDRRIVFATLTEHGLALTEIALTQHLEDLRRHLEAPLGTDRMLGFAETARVLRDHHRLPPERLHRSVLPVGPTG